MANSIFQMGLGIGEEIEAKAERMHGMGASLDSQLANIYKVRKTRSTKVFERLMDMEDTAYTSKYQEFKAARNPPLRRHGVLLHN